MPLLEAGDETKLPRCFNGAWIVVLPDVCDRLVVGYSVEHGEAGQRGAGSSVSAGAGDLDAFGFSTCPCLTQRVGGCGTVGRKPEVGPSEPSAFPGYGWWMVAQ
jgi:hypothetical protein